jgi:hypothetical protein
MILEFAISNLLYLRLFLFVSCVTVTKSNLQQFSPRKKFEMSSSKRTKGGHFSLSAFIYAGKQDDIKN